MDNNIVIFESEDKSVCITVQMSDDTVWLNRNQLAELFGRDVKTIGKHINNTLKEELSDDDSTVAKFATTDNNEKEIISVIMNCIDRKG